MVTTVMADSEKELKNHLMRVKEKSEKASLKLNVKKKKKREIIAFSPITSWQIERGKSGSSDRFCFLGLQSHWTVTAAMKLEDNCFLGGKL